jgi:xanthine dehydrogenase/oxidase
VQELLEGKELTAALINEACRVASEEVTLTDSHYTAYHKRLVSALLFKALSKILQKGEAPTPDIHATKVLPTPRATDYKTDIFGTTRSGAPCANKQAPIGEGIVKLTANMQTAGEIKYSNDVRVMDCAYACYVTSTRACAKVTAVDTSSAEASYGVICYIDGRDVPGRNDCNDMCADPEPLFAATGGVGRVDFYGQPVGMIIADTEEHAKAAAALVEVAYEEEEAILTVDDAVAKESFHGWENAMFANDLTSKHKQGSATQVPPLSLTPVIICESPPPPLPPPTRAARCSRRIPRTLCV